VRARSCDLRVQDPVHAAVVALLAVEVAVDRLGEQRVDDLVLLFLLDQDVEVELRPQRGDLLHQLQRADLQAARAPCRRCGAVPRVLHRVELVVDDDDLDVAVALDQLQPFLGGQRADEGDAERVVERARRGVQALEELLAGSAARR
jgi:hypothetical protein